MGDKKKQVPQRRVALYRKYRSKSLDQIIGQEHITKTLANAIAQGKISHAYLFTGPRGTGKTSIARILAHEINGTPYNDELTNLDIIEIDAASNRRIDDIRELRDKVHIAPVSSKYKVYIIDEVHMLTTESFNALLKTLEEPPEHVVFILATTEVHKLPATIISRTQRHSFKSIALDQAVAHLAQIAKNEGITISHEALELLATHGNGSLRDSTSLLDQLSTQSSEVNLETVELLLGIAPKVQLQLLLETVLDGNLTTTLTQVTTLLESGLTPSGVANQLAIVIRDSLGNGVGGAFEVTLLSNLLTVHGSVYPQLTLEAILLKAASDGQPTTPVGQPKPIKQEAAKPAESTRKAIPQLNAAATDKTPQAEVKNPSPKSALKKTPKLPDSFIITDIWPDILSQVKLKNNPLYTVLRLAHPEVTDGVLRLIFAFPFHQKRAEDTKNKNIIAQIVAEVTGHNLTVETTIDKTKTPPEAATGATLTPEVEPATASVIDSVRDIMGGGEVVNV